MSFRILSLMLLLLSTLAQAKVDDTLYIGKGETLVKELDQLAISVKLTKSGVVEVDRGETKKILLIKGRSSGSTTMNIKLQSGKIKSFLVHVVASRNISGSFASIQKNLSNIRGVKIEKRGSKVVITGKIKTRGDLQSLKQVKRRFPGLIVDSTQTQLYGSNTVVKTINRVLKENDMANMQAHAYGRVITLEGSAKNNQQKKFALKISGMIYPGIVDRVDETTKGAPSLSIEVVFIEVQKTSGLEFGLNYSFGGGDVSGAGPITGTTAAKAGSQGGLNWMVGPMGSFLKLVQGSTSSRVLSNPKLVVRSGETASFHSGNTTYFKIIKPASGKDGESAEETLVPIKTGIELEISASIDSLGQIDARVSTSIKERAALAGAGTFNISDSSVDTAVTIRDGDSILLSGLMRVASSKTVDRVPLLADIPILGELFKSRSFTDEKTDLIILINVSRVKGHQQTIRADQTRLWKDSKSDVEFQFFD